jgi:A/G-specific adenine glycosylase
MGYYRRARNLHRAAQTVVNEYRGQVPRDVESLRQLPGVGRYTAGAIASIAFGKPAPIVDGNVARVLARLYARNDAPVDSAEHVAWTWETAARLVEVADEPGVFNEGLMELGATVCTPRSPKCESCPLAKLCAARKQGLQNDIPAAKARAKPQACVHHAVVVSRSNGEVLVEQRPAGGMWAGLWQVPTIEGESKLESRTLVSMLPFAVAGLTHRGTFDHLTTHRHITFHVFAAKSRKRTGRWIEAQSNAIAKLPMSAAQRRVLKLALESG